MAWRMSPAAMPFFAKATLDLPYADGADDERRQLEDKHAKLIYTALRKLMRLVAPADTTVTNITPDIAVQRYRDNQHILRDALVAMLTDGAMLGADVGKAQTEAAMGVGTRKATPTITGVDWDLINDDVLQWVMGGGLGSSDFGQGYADTLATAMAGTSERGLRTLIGEWVRNDLSYRQLVTDLERSLFSRRRAEMVIETEITKSFFEGQRASFIRGQVITQMQWYTVVDERVCSRCGPRHMQITDVHGDFGGETPPIHPRCRCFVQPWIG
jgi:SPP1 gp7 family putative phage head morphogenesis protein